MRFSIANPMKTAVCGVFMLTVGLVGINAVMATKGSALTALPVLQRLATKEGMVFVLKVSPESAYRLKLGVSPRLAPIDDVYWQIIEKPKPLFLLNAGFFDPVNQQSSSYLIQAGQPVGNPMQNPRLVDNPKLTPYLPQIFNRSEFRVYACETSSPRYDIVPHNAPVPSGCKVDSAAGAGPLLLPERTDKEEAFIDTDAQGQRSRDPIGVDAHNARSAIGLNAAGDVLLLMAAQKPDGSGGVSLAELATLLKKQGATKAMALDGGSSSSLRYRNESIYGRINSKGQPVRRPVKSVWMVLKPD
jgi:hypothetical protein